jgi:hypothetical protein
MRSKRGPKVVQEGGKCGPRPSQMPSKRAPNAVQEGSKCGPRGGPIRPSDGLGTRPSWLPHL